jgi:hypothetical protein
MGLFNRNPKETPEAPEKRAVATMSRFVNMLVECDGESINATENARVAYCVFVVGAVSAYAMKHGLEAPQAHAVALVLFQKMGMDLDRCAQLAHFGILATSKGTRWNYASNAGMDEFFEWEQRPEGYLPAYLQPALAKAS